MTVPFFIHDATGAVLRYGFCQEADLPHQIVREGEALQQGEANLEGYVVDGTFVPYTPEELAKKAQPKPGFAWSVATRDWEDVRTLDEAKDHAWERIKRDRFKAEAAGFLHNGILFDSDPVSITRISGAVQLALLAQMAGQSFAITWTVADNSTIELDAAGMIAVGGALGRHVNAGQERGRILREQIAQAASADALDAIVWET